MCGITLELHDRAKRIRELEQALELVEWNGCSSCESHPQGPTCPCCGGEQPKHEDGCVVGAALSHRYFDKNRSIQG